MACLDCTLCSLTMEFPNWDDQTEKSSMACREKVLYASPVSDTVSPVIPVDRVDQQQVVDDSEEEYGNVSGAQHSVLTYRGKYVTADSSVNSSGYSEESGFCSETTLNLHCAESSVWWSGEGIVHYEDSGSSLPASPEIGKTESRQTFTGFDDYSVEIYRHRKKVESKAHFLDCLKYQREITPAIRRVLVSWLTKVNQEFQLSQETLFLTVNIVDRCMKVMHVSRECFQLVGATALLIAGKHEEVTPPEIQDLLWLCGDTYTREQMKELEKIILEALNFDLFVPTANFFLEYFAFSEITSRGGKDESRLRNARRQARYFLQQSLQDYELCQFLPSMLALCAWKAGVRDCMTEYSSYPPWEVDFEQDPFDECYREFIQFISRLNTNFQEVNSLNEHLSQEEVEDSETD